MFLAKRLSKHVEIEITGIKTELALSWATGMIGCIPVFETKEDAEAYGGGSDTEEIKQTANV